MKRLAVGAFTILLVHTMADPGRAELCLKATGTVTDLIGFSSGASLPFEVGDSYVATIKIDSSTVDSMGSDPDLGLYLGAITDFEFTIGDYSGSFVPSNDTAILVANNMDLFATDTVALTSAPWDGDDVAGMSASSAQFAGFTATGLVDSDSLPGGSDFESFSIGSFGFVFEGTGGQLAAVAGRASLVSTPEPATWMVLCAAAPMAIGRRVAKRLRRSKATDAA